MGQIKTVLIHAAHVAGAAALTALVGFLATNHAQIIAALPLADQHGAELFLALLAMMYSKSPLAKK